MAEAPPGTLFVETERDFDLLSRRDVVRIKYRREPARRWTKFVVFPEPEQKLEQIERRAEEIARLHEEGAWKT